MRTKIFEIPNKLIVELDSETGVIIDSWKTYFVSLDEFKEAVMVHGVNHAKMHNCKAWIVDSHKAKGAFSKDIQDYIGAVVFPTFAKIGIKHFMTITAKDALTRATVSQYSEKAGPNGLKVLIGSSAEGAIEWLSKKQ